MKEQSTEQQPRLRIVLLILGLFLIVSFIAAVFIAPEDEFAMYNTAVIPIKGVIVTDGSNGLFDEGVASSTDIVAQIEKARDDPQVEAVIFEINSPGGSPVATDEIAQAIASLHESNKTTVAWIREAGASGAYWIATSTDHIVANRMSVVGSIGVYGSYLEWSGLLNKYNVTYQRLVAGKYKDAGSPLRKLTDEEEFLIQEKLDAMHHIFIQTVAENRKLPVDTVERLATGEIFLGIEGREIGLIDELGGKKEAQLYIEQTRNITVETKEFVDEQTFFDLLAGMMQTNSFALGKGIGTELIRDGGLRITT